MEWCGTLSLLLCVCLWRTATGQGTVTLSLQFVSEAEPGFPYWTVPTMCMDGRIGLVQAYVQQEVSGTPQLVMDGGMFTALELLNKGPERGIQLSFSYNVSTGGLWVWV